MEQLNQVNIHDPNSLEIIQMFNQQHAQQIIEQKLLKYSTFSKIKLKDVGIKIMRMYLDKFEQHNIRQAEINYNWNRIMIMPKLICYDKNTWKTLQQLTNWSRQWSQMFKNCIALQKVVIKFTCSFMDAQFTKSFLEGIAKLPNIKSVDIELESKLPQVENILIAFSKAQIFNQFTYKFKLYQQ